VFDCRTKPNKKKIATGNVKKQFLVWNGTGPHRQGENGPSREGGGGCGGGRGNANRVKKSETPAGNRDQKKKTLNQDKKKTQRLGARHILSLLTKRPEKGEQKKRKKGLNGGGCPQRSWTAHQCELEKRKKTRKILPGGAEAFLWEP